MTELPKNPLPFDELPTYDIQFNRVFNPVITYHPDVRTLLERLEAYNRKIELIKYSLVTRLSLDPNDIKRRVGNEEHHNGANLEYTSWGSWKEILEKASSKSWPEIAEILYWDFF